MQAFKAANPTAILEDFVRWHSPRDFILVSESASAGGNNTLSDISSCSSTSTVSPSSDDVEVEEEGVVVVEKDGKEKIFRARVYKSGVCGSLSVRMMDPDNLWNELWRVKNVVDFCDGSCVPVTAYNPQSFL